MIVRERCIHYPSPIPYHPPLRSNTQLLGTPHTTTASRSSPPASTTTDASILAAASSRIPAEGPPASASLSAELEAFDHEVGANDTLFSLSLRFGVPLFDLKQANGMLHTSDTLPLMMATLRIPGTEPSLNEQQLTEDDMVAAHASEMKCDTGEARFYLADNAWGVAAALLAHRQDLDWEKMNPMPEPQEAAAAGGKQADGAGGSGGAGSGSRAAVHPKTA